MTDMSNEIQSFHTKDINTFVRRIVQIVIYTSDKYLPYLVVNQFKLIIYVVNMGCKHSVWHDYNALR